MSVINTNMSALVATNAIIANDRDQEIAMERLSTGLRINSASDDAAGLAISSRMQAEVSGLNMATRNANDAISMIETIEGSSREIGAALQRMRELTVQAASDTYGVTDRAALDLEFGQLMTEMQRIATQTTWNGITVMDGFSGNTDANLATATQAGPNGLAGVTSESLVIQLGKASGQNMTLTIKSFDPQAAIKSTARMELVNPVTGATLPITVTTPAHNLTSLTPGTDGRFVNGGNWLTNTGPGGNGMTTVQAAAAFGLNRLGNDNHNLQVSPGSGPTPGTVASRTALTNRRDAETQAYGSAVLWTGNALDATRRVPLVDPVTGDAGTRVNILSRVNANYTLTQLDIAISAVSAERAKYGAYIARFEHAGDNLTNVARHQEQSRSRIADADYAIETSELSRTTIIAQASTAMLAQANAAKQTVLTLLQ
jgi:flagellin